MNDYLVSTTAFYLINARDLNDAIQGASKIRSARLGSVEVRPIREFEKQ